MNMNAAFRPLLVVCAMLALPIAHAANLTKADYEAEKARVGAVYKSDQGACTSFAANAKDICSEQAKAKQKVAYAELEHRYTGKAADLTKLEVAKAESTYAVAKEQCDDLKGNERDVCVKQAKAVEVKALADAKMGRQITEAKTDAGQAKRDADYQVAAEKCDAMAGDAKASCLNAAKVRFGKT